MSTTNDTPPAGLDPESKPERAPHDHEASGAARLLEQAITRSPEGMFAKPADASEYRRILLRWVERAWEGQPSSSLASLIVSAAAEIGVDDTKRCDDLALLAGLGALAKFTFAEPF